MKIRFTNHAQSQALAREIPESLIAEAVRSPDSTDSAPGGAMMYRKSLENGTLEVICKKGKAKNEYLVLTAYYL